MTAVVERLRRTPVLHLADQVLSSGTNFLAVVFVARNATPQEFGIFSILLVAFFVTTGFNRAVPHAIAMTMQWDDDRIRSGYFFLPAAAMGSLAAGALVVAFAILEPSWVVLPLILVPLLLQDAVRMHAFAVQQPGVALLSDAVWLGVSAAGFLLASTAPGAAAAWGLGGVCGLLVTRPWRIRVRLQRRPIKANAISAALEFATLAGLGYLTPLLASPIITVVGIGALQGANMIRGPIILLVQGLIVHRMSGPAIASGASVGEALRLSLTTLGVTVLCIPPLLLLRDVYGPPLLGSTWPQVEPLVVPALVTLVLGSVAFGPATVVRKMGLFSHSARVQGAAAPAFVLLPLLGASVAGTRGFLFGLALAYGLLATAWWIVLPRLASRSDAGTGVAVS